VYSHTLIMRRWKLDVSDATHFIKSVHVTWGSDISMGSFYEFHILSTS